MNTKQGGRGGRQTTENFPQGDDYNPVEQYTCCVTGLVVMCAIAVLFYPVLIAVTQPLQILSSTAVVFVLISVWLLAWVGVVAIWEWRAGRVAVPG